jgi:probable F420-dependent oxidoreductase
MKIGLFTIGLGKGARPAYVRQIAQHAERLNFARLWAPEHAVLVDKQMSKYPYSATGQFTAPSTLDFLDPFVALTYAAAITTKIRLATGICLVPEHNPVMLAKAAASLDYVSGGRFTFGIGIGWLAEEFQALGIPFERRADRTREYIAAMRRLWGEEKSSFHGEFVDFEGVRSFPKPASGDALPVIVGGESLPALRRVAEYGNGWYGFNLMPDGAAAKIASLEAMLRERGRDRKEIEIVVSPYMNKITRDDLKGYREAGVDEVVLALGLPKDEREIPSHMEQVAREFVEPAAALG